MSGSAAPTHMPAQPACCYLTFRRILFSEATSKRILKQLGWANADINKTIQSFNKAADTSTGWLGFGESAMSKSNFSKWLKSMGIEESLVDVLDTNGDGKIDIREMFLALIATEPRVAKKQAKTASLQLVDGVPCNLNVTNYRRKEKGVSTAKSFRRRTCFHRHGEQHCYEREVLFRGRHRSRSQGVQRHPARLREPAVPHQPLRWQG